MIEFLENEIVGFAVISLVIILLAIMSRKREQDFKEFDKNEDNMKDSKK